MSTVTLPQGDWIRGISVQQPHVTCILTGAKGIENRPKPWSRRGWMLLHAGRRIDRPVLRVPHKACAEDWITANPVEARLGRFASDLAPKPK
ncbi:MULTISPECIES: hypothetical protein [unclassified Streptomyces]|uniref:hypothetical protein n=1 Tax=unclassified Streptomyces TaxID=2593676 RepID=UPI000B0BBFBE|nr:hypothetical protein [Streptomyces sp. TSRI0107]